ncbi:MAG: T9SS type A sorting domain-containing protein [Polaribacter sp.]|uniref:T9SS type A sorting domain-containing protein n=1 Tax=Polaribacter sp. TaxID=1920175 RepID=UPI002F35EE72
MKTSLLILVFLLFIEQTNSQTIQKLDSVHFLSWDTSNTNWRLHTREILTFDNNGNKETNYLRLNLSGTNWDNFYQTLKEYDANNNLIETNFQNWNLNTDVWDNSTKYVYNYLVNNVSSDAKFYYWSDIWTQVEKTSYQYSADNIIEEIVEVSDGTNPFVNSTKTEYEYASDKIILQTKLIWRDFLNNWQNNERIIYENVGGNLIKKSWHGWNISNQEWSENGYKKTDYSYNAEGLVSEAETVLVTTGIGVEKFIYTYPTNQSITIHQQWYSVISDFRNYFKHIRTFNTNEDLDEHILQKWDTTDDLWRNDSRYLYFWSDALAFSLNIEKVKQEVTANIFPIPAKNNLNIQFSEQINVASTLYFYDVNGKELFKKKIQPNEQKITLKTPTYNGAILFLKIENKLGNATYKVLLDK